MEYKVFRVVFDDNTAEYNIPNGWAVQQIIFATDTHAVLILNRYPPSIQEGQTLASPSYDYRVGSGYSAGGGSGSVTFATVPNTLTTRPY